MEMKLFWGKKKILTSDSIGKITWRRFRKNKPAMLGLYFIVGAALVGLLGYTITTDKTPFANDQKPELHIIPPGTSVKFLLVHKNEETQHDNFLSRMLYGAQSPYQSIPFYSISFKKEKVFVEEYTGHEPNNGYISEYNIADVLYPLQNKKEVIHDSINHTLSFIKF